MSDGFSRKLPTAPGRVFARGLMNPDSVLELEIHEHRGELYARSVVALEHARARCEPTFAGVKLATLRGGWEFRPA